MHHPTPSLTRPLILAAVLISLAAIPVAAQPLAERIPASATVYAAWQGTEALGEKYGDSRLKVVLDSWQPLQKMRDVLRPLAEREGGPQAAAMFDSALDLAAIFARRPTAFYVGPITIDPQRGPPVPPFAIICDAGPDADALHAKIAGILATAPDDAIRLLRRSSTVAIATGTVSDAALARMGLVDAAPAPALNETAAFAAALAATSPDPAAMIYVDFRAITAPFFAMIEAEQGDEELALARRVSEQLGVSGLRSIAWTGRFDGRDWATVGWINAPSPRRGLLTLLDAEPLGEPVLRAIPGDAHWFNAQRFDPVKLMRIIRATAEAAAGPEALVPLDEADAALGVDIENELIPAFGDRWVIYADSTTLGPMGMPGFLVVHWPRDPASLDTMLDRLLARAADALAEQAEDAVALPAMMAPQLGREDSGGTTIHYLTVQGMSPALAVDDRHLYLGISSAAVAARLVNDLQPDDSMLRSARFSAVVERLGRDDYTGVTYAYLPNTAPVVLQQFQMYASILAMSADTGVDVLRLLPPSGPLISQLTATASVSWADETGYHWRSVEPFPGARSLSPGGMISPTSSVPAAGLMAGILIPSLSRAREVARRTVSAANLKDLFTAMYQYSVRHNDQYPDDLAVLVNEGSISPDQLINPRTGNELPDDLDFAGYVQWARTNSDYVYLASGKRVNDFAPDDVVMYERLTDDTEEGISICFGDGHVAWHELDVAIPMLQRASQPIPERFRQYLNQP